MVPCALLSPLDSSPLVVFLAVSAAPPAFVATALEGIVEGLTMSRLLPAVIGLVGWCWIADPPLMALAMDMSLLSPMVPPMVPPLVLVKPT
jgi:hypothetical protein